MLLKNTRTGYGLVAISLHWLIAFVVIGLIIIGLYMVNIPISLRKLALFGWHKEFGILVLMLVSIRIVWRFTNITPWLPADMPAYEKFAARCAHFAFYILLFALPITGWMLSSAAGLPVSFFGFWLLPDLVSPDPILMEKLIFIHTWLSYTLIALLAAHISAALQHHFYRKDDILIRIIKPEV